MNRLFIVCIGVILLLSAGASRLNADGFPYNDLTALKKEIRHNSSDLGVYETFVAALESSGYLKDRNPDDLVRILKENIDEVEDFQAFKMMGIALYGRGYAEQAAACSEVFQKHALPIGEASGRVDKIIKTIGENKPPSEDKTASGARTARIANPADKSTAVPTFTKRIRLKNGRRIEGIVLKESAKGLWLESGPGASIYLTKDEFTSVESVDPVSKN